MKSGLPIKLLQSLCDDFKQDIVDGPFGSELQRKDYITEGVPVLKIQNIKPFAIELKKTDYVSQAKFQELRRHSYQRGDIVMTKLGRPLGVAAIVENLEEGLIVADLVRIRAQRINTKYLCYHLNSQRTNDFINSMQKGTTRPRVTLSVVRELPIFFPSPSEQQRIVGILDEAFDGIATAKANAEKNLQNARAVFESHLQCVFTQCRERWTAKNLGDVCRVIGGGTPSKDKAEYYSGEIPWATVRDLRSDMITETECKITKAAVASSATNIIPHGNVVIATRVGLGKVCMIGQDTAINQDLRGIVPIDPKVLSVRFLFWWLKSIAYSIVAEGTGATVQGVKLPFVKSLQLPLPPLPEQQRIVGILDALSAETHHLASLYQQKLLALEALKKSLLNQSFTGEL